VVYLENEAVDRMLEKARGEGKTLVEWAREALVAELEDNSGLPRPEPVRVARRRASAIERLPELAEAPAVEADGQKRCKHGTPKGWHCWQCGGMAIIEG